MTLYLATSCLQGRPLQQVCEQLLTMPIHGLQLCAGNAPTVGFEDWRATCRRPLRTHHGFTSRALRHPVWSSEFVLNGTWDSVHPPRQADPDWLPDALPPGVCLEVMYGDYPLGTGQAVQRAMARGVPLAVDVSHVYIQRCQGVMDEATWTQLREYPHIHEVHVSANDGRSDRHAPIEPTTFGLRWAQERAADGIPVVLESYWHRLTNDDRARQIERVVGTGH